MRQYMCVCELGVVFCRRSCWQISTGKHRPYWPTYICVFAHLQGVGLGRNTTYLQREWPVCVCVRTRMCLQREWPAPKCPSASVSAVEISTHTLKHICYSTPLEQGQVCVCVRMILHIRNCCFDRSFMALLLKAMHYVMQSHWLTKTKCVCVCVCVCGGTLVLSCVLVKFVHSVLDLYITLYAGISGIGWEFVHPPFVCVCVCV